MWEIHAFRALDEHCQEQKYYREVVARFRYSRWLVRVF
jgi:hypothetical protein